MDNITTYILDPEQVRTITPGSLKRSDFISIYPDFHKKAIILEATHEIKFKFGKKERDIALPYLEGGRTFACLKTDEGYSMLDQPFGLSQEESDEQLGGDIVGEGKMDFYIVKMEGTSNGESDNDLCVAL